MKKKSAQELWYWPEDYEEYKGKIILDKKKMVKPEEELWHWPRDKEYKEEIICFWR